MTTPLRYLVELQPPRAGWQDLPSVASRARIAAEQLSAEGIPVRFLRSIFVPEDETCFFLFESDGSEHVRQALTRADLEPGAFVETVSAPHAQQTQGQTPTGPRSDDRSVTGKVER